MEVKKAKSGLSTAPREKPKKRPGVHKKSRNKQEKPIIPSASPWLLSADIVPSPLIINGKVDWLDPFLN